MNGDSPSVLQQKSGKLTCDICFKFDEFALCNKCFQVYREKTITFRKNVKSEKFQLKSCLQEIINQNYQTFNSWNKKSERIIKLDKLQRMVNDVESVLKLKKNMIIVITEKIKKKKENLKKFKEIIFKENRLLDDGINAHPQGLKIMNDKKVHREKINLFYLDHLLNSIFRKRIEMEDYLEIQEYVKPDLAKKQGSNKIEGQVSSNAHCMSGNDMREFDNLPNVLSVTNSGVLFNYNHKDYDFNYDKVIKIKSEVLKNRQKVFNINNYIYSLVIFQKCFSIVVDIPLTYSFDENDILKIKNPVTDSQYTLYLDSDVNTHNENYLNELIQGYMYLDINLKNLLGFLKPEIIRKEVKKYKNCYIYSSSPATSDMKEFLNINKLLPKLNEDLYMGFGEMIEVKKYDSYDIQIMSVEDKKLREEEGFVIIDNFYI
jgi:hypothetical protein